MHQWEYKIIDLGSARAEQGEIILNAMGEQGWELVAVSQAMAFEESAALGGMFAAVVRLPAAKTLAYFKRPRVAS
jgi:Domain of unknown function (DUF4177)